MRSVVIEHCLIQCAFLHFCVCLHSGQTLLGAAYTKVVPFMDERGVSRTLFDYLQRRVSKLMFKQLLLCSLLTFLLLFLVKCAG